MTTTEAIDALVAADPSRTFNVEKSVFSHAKTEYAPQRTVFEYSVTAIPGYNGNSGQRISSKDGFDKPVADFIALAKQIPATKNDE